MDDVVSADAVVLSVAVDHVFICVVPAGVAKGFGKMQPNLWLRTLRAMPSQAHLPQHGCA